MRTARATPWGSTGRPYAGVMLRILIGIAILAILVVLFLALVGR
jgi:hypothetical protein